MTSYMGPLNLSSGLMYVPASVLCTPMGLSGDISRAASGAGNNVYIIGIIILSVKRYEAKSVKQQPKYPE